MPGDQAPKHTGVGAGQAILGRYNWDKLIAPLLDVVDSGVNFHSTPGLPEGFMEMAERVAGVEVDLLGGIFLNVTSKNNEIAKQSVAVYQPYVYDTRDPYFPKVLGLKMSEDRPGSQLAKIALGVDLKQGKLVLVIQNAKLKFKKDNPSLIFIQGNDDLEIVENSNEQSKDGSWTDKEFGEFAEEVILAGNALALA